MTKSILDIHNENLRVAMGTTGVVMPLCDPPRYHVGVDVVRVERPCPKPHYEADYIVKPRACAMASAFYAAVEMLDGEWNRLAGEWNGTSWDLHHGDAAIPIGKLIKNAIARATA